jgi:hypothetical protein
LRRRRPEALAHVHDSFAIDAVDIERDAPHVLWQHTDLWCRLLLCSGLRLRLLWSRGWRRRGRNCHGRATWRGLNDWLWCGRRILPSRHGYTTYDDCCRRDAEPSACNEVTSSDDGLHLFFSWRTAIRLGRLLAC